MPFPAAALPILEAHVFDQPVWAPHGFDDELVFGHGMGVGRLDVNDGSVITRPLAVGDEPKAEVFYAVTDGSTYVAVADVGGQGTVDVVAMVDAQTLERTGGITSTPPDSVHVAQAGGEAPRRLFTSGPDGFYDLDVAGAQRGARFELLDPLQPTVTSTVSDFALSLDRQLWAWDLNGLVQVYEANGTSLGAVDLEHTFGVYASTAVLVTPSSLWLIDTTTSEMFRIDRQSLEPTHRLDLRDHFTWADGVRLRTTGRPTDRFVVANAVVGDDGWWLLVEVDPETGDVVSEHVIATDANDYGWNAFDAPELARVGDRLFVRDHRRRIVEVDVAALGRRSAIAWTDPGLGRAPVLNSDEQEVAELALEFVDGDDVIPPLTDPALSAEALTVLAARRVPGSTWEIHAAETDGDRASVRSAPVGEIGAYFVFRRFDGEWRLDSEALCELLRVLGDPCGLG